jgi:Phage integrase, N-terminal SAM-like domain
VGWLEGNRHQLKHGSWRRHEEIVRLHIVPKLGKLALSKLTFQDVQRLYTAKLDEGLTSTGVRYMHRTLRWARRKPTANVRSPTIWRGRSRHRVRSVKRCTS